MRWILALLIVAGCAHSPQEIRDDGIRAELLSSRPPVEAAACVARNAEAMSFGIDVRPTVSMRPIGAGAYELVVNMTAIHGPMAYARVDPAPAGARIQTWYVTTPPIIGAGQLAGIAAGC